jgi:aspartate aminotransferase
MRDQPKMKRKLSKRSGGDSHSEKIVRAFAMIVMAENDPEVMNLSHGNPAYPPPVQVLSAYQAAAETLVFNDQESITEPVRVVQEAHQRIHLNRYRPLPLIIKSLDRAAYDYFRSNNIPVQLHENGDPRKAEITAGSGTTQLYMAAIHALVDPGEYLLLPWPYYRAFLWMTTITANRIQLIEPDPSNDYKITPDSLRRSLESCRSRCLVLTSPSNPAGAVYSRAEYEALIDVLSLPQFSHVAIIADEVNDKIVLDEGSEFVSFAALGNMFQRTITLAGVSKSLGLANERVGIACGPAEIIWAMSQFVLVNTGGVPDLTQLLAASALADTPSDYYGKAVSLYSQNLAFVAQAARHLNEGLNRHFHTHGEGYVGLINVPKGGFFVCVRFAVLRGRCYGDDQEMTNDFDVFRFLLERGRISSVPGSAQGFPEAEMVVRFTLAASPASLELAWERISSSVFELVRSSIAKPQSAILLAS